MGVPYSQEVKAAVDQLAPLIADVQTAKQTAKKAFILFAAVQVLKAATLAGFLAIFLTLVLLILLAMLALLITVNPDLDHERATIVTPAVKWIIRRFSKLMSVMRLQKDMRRLKAEGLQEKVQ